jgi:phosphosulfolactate synthase
MGDKLASLIWEAPLKSQQAFFIEKFGANAGLGNIPIDQVLALEALRNGLRFDTLNRVTGKLLREGSWDPNQVEANRMEQTIILPTRPVQKRNDQS